MLKFDKSVPVARYRHSGTAICFELSRLKLTTQVQSDFNICNIHRSYDLMFYIIFRDGELGIKCQALGRTEISKSVSPVTLAETNFTLNFIVNEDKSCTVFMISSQHRR